MKIASGPQNLDKKLTIYVWKTSSGQKTQIFALVALSILKNVVFASVDFLEKISLSLVTTSNILSKLPNAPFLLSTHLTSGEGPFIGHLGPWGPHMKPPNNIIYPWTSPFSLAAFQEGKDQ